MAEPMDIALCVSEMSLSGPVSLGRCSVSTVYRWAKACNEYLLRERAEWRVKPDPKNRELIPYDLIPPDGPATGNHASGT